MEEISSLIETQNGEESFDPITVMRRTYDVDVVVISGMLTRRLANAVIDAIDDLGDEKKTNVCLVISTFGGDADAAYIIARTIKRTYKHFRLHVHGYCKSAGTLIALGADEIVMTKHGELGPLDVQLLKEDTLGNFGSGLDISKAMKSLSSRAFGIFEEHFLEIMRRSQGSITTKTAFEIASRVTTGLVSPITGQLDPLKFGEIQRAMDIAFEYGHRLGASPYVVHHLIHHYPSHSFVIDFEEATELFPCVRMADELDLAVGGQIQQCLDQQFGQESIRVPHDEGVVVIFAEHKEQGDATDNGHRVSGGHVELAGAEGGVSDHAIETDSSEG